MVIIQNIRRSTISRSGSKGLGIAGKGIASRDGRRGHPFLCVGLEEGLRIPTCLRKPPVAERKRESQESYSDWAVEKTVGKERFENPTVSNLGKQ